MVRWTAVAVGVLGVAACATARAQAPSWAPTFSAEERVVLRPTLDVVATRRVHVGGAPSIAIEQDPTVRHGGERTAGVVVLASVAAVCVGLLLGAFAADDWTAFARPSFAPMRGDHGSYPGYPRVPFRTPEAVGLGVAAIALAIVGAIIGMALLELRDSVPEHVDSAPPPAPAIGPSF